MLCRYARVLLCMILTIPLLAWAEGGMNTAKPESQVSATSAPKGALKITLTPSRDQAVADSDFGVTGRVENVSDKVVYLTPTSLSLIAPPEIDPDGPRNWTALFGSTDVVVTPEASATTNAVPEANKGVDQQANNEQWWNAYNQIIIPLAPGSTISAFWSLRKESKNWFIKEFMNFYDGLKFSPGRYTLTVVAGYWDTFESAQSSAPDWHTQSVDMQEVISAPQSTIFFGAILGGMFAFMLVWKANPSLYSKMGFFSAPLLSILVTILLSRLSESQFIVRVTVSDVWGAMAVGFIGAASGPAILQKFTSPLAVRATDEEAKQEAEKKVREEAEQKRIENLETPEEREAVPQKFAKAA